MKKTILIIPVCVGITNENKFDVGKEFNIEIIEEVVSLSVKENILTKQV